VLELPEATRERIYELQELSDKAQDDDEEARQELRHRLAQEAPEVVARCSDSARSYRRLLAKRSSAGNPLVEEAISERARRMALELAGEAPTPLAVLLSERVASLWVLVELQEALLAAYYYKASAASPAFVLQMTRLQESSNRRLSRGDKDPGPSAEAAGPFQGAGEHRREPGQRIPLGAC
jgi:hypothetical protein